MSLEAIGEGIWLADGPIVDFYSFPYPTRMVVVRLDDGTLWVWSPIALTADLRAEIEALGRPAHLIAPNRLHHLFLKDWATAWPAARVWASAGTRRHLKAENFTDTLTEIPPPEWSGLIDQTIFTGNPIIEEAVFFHRPSGTAIFTDLSENFSGEFLRTHWSGWKRTIARFWKITEPHGMAPLEMRLTWFGRKSGRRAMGKVIGWHPDKIVMAHGEWIRHDGMAFLSTAFKWLR